MEKVKLIRGSKERAEEIRRTLEDWSGINKYSFSCDIKENYYYVDPLLSICRWIDEEIAKELISEGKAEIYELPPMKPKYEFKPFDKVLVRDYEDREWVNDIFCFMKIDESFKCIGGSWEYCIPYEGNEYLLGTKNNPK